MLNVQNCAVGVKSNDTRYFFIYAQLFFDEWFGPQPAAEMVDMGWICPQKQLAVITSYSSSSYRKSNVVNEVYEALWDDEGVEQWLFVWIQRIC